MAWKKCRSCKTEIPKSDRYGGLCVECWGDSPAGRAHREQIWDQHIENERQAHGPYHAHIAGAARAVEVYPEDELEEYAVRRRSNPCHRNPVSMKRKAEVIARALGLDDRTNAEHVAGLISGKLDPEEFESVQKWVRQCYHKPRHAELVMEALNEVLAGFGVEAIRSEYAYVDSFHHDIIATYVNQGDSYLPTVIYETARDKFVIEAVGDWVERNERKYRIR